MICVVIPTLNSKLQLEQLLAQLPKDARIVVTDGGSDDGTLMVAASFNTVMCAGTAGRGLQLKRGVSWALDKPWLLVLHVDSVLPESFMVYVEQHIANHSDKAGYFDLKFASSRMSAKVIERLVRLRCHWFGLPYGDQGLLISRDLYEEIGGFENIPLFEDVALIQKIGKRRLRRVGASLITNATKFEREGFFLKGWKNYRLLRRYLKGEHPENLAKEYS